jgi:S-adenosylmethionine/arginine decarboxylase-like enzyme
MNYFNVADIISVLVSVGIFATILAWLIYNDHQKNDRQLPHLNHKHFLGTAYIARPPENTDFVGKWLSQLVEKIGMRVLMGPHVINCLTEGNEGITGVIVLETSHSSCHFWCEVPRPFFTFDIYSCKDFDIEVIKKHIDEAFGLIELKYGVINRNNGIKLTEIGNINLVK